MATSEGREDAPPPAFAGAAARRFYLGVSLAALGVIFYETVAFQTLVFLSDYMRAIQVVAIALLGLSLGGLAAFALRPRATPGFFVRAALGPPIATAAAFAAVCLFPGRPVVLLVALMLPFVAASLLISLSFALAPSHRVYFVDLAGAAAGAVVACAAVPLLREEGSFLLLIALGLVAVVVFAGRDAAGTEKRLRDGAAVAAVLAALGLGLHVGGMHGRADYFNFVRLVRPTSDRAKLFTVYHDRRDADEDDDAYAKLLYSRGSLVERIDLVKVRAGRVATFFNAYANDHVSRTSVEGFRGDLRLPYGLVTDPDVLVIGTAAEGIVKTARGLGRGAVVGLEINPAIMGLMTGPMFEWSRRAYEGIELHAVDARSYLKRTDRKFDVISMLNTHRMRNLGNAGQPEYLHTEEAFADLFDHLTDRGWIVLEERDVNDRARVGIRRIVLNARHVLAARLGVADPSRHFWVYDWYGPRTRARSQLYTSIFIKKTPVTDADLAFMAAYAAPPPPAPGKLPQGPFVDYVPGGPTDHPIAKLIAQGSPDAIYDPATYNLSPFTDDRPFPFDVLRARDHLRRVLVPTVALTLVLGLLPVAVLLARHGIRMRRSGAGRGLAFGGAAVLYFSLLGTGYLMIEVVLIQRLQMFIGMPVLTLAAVLGTMLLFSGVGGLASRNWARAPQLLAIAGIVALAVALIAGMDRFQAAFIGLPLPARIALVVVLLAPLSLLMGTPFPYGVRRVKERLGDDRFAALLFGLNGAFSALATPLALTVATIHGFRVAYLAGAAVYAACLALAAVLGRGGNAAETTR